MAWPALVLPVHMKPVNIKFDSNRLPPQRSAYSVLRKKRHALRTTQYVSESPRHIVHDQVFQPRPPQRIETRLHFGQAVAAEVLDQRIGQPKSRHGFPAHSDAR